MGFPSGSDGKPTSNEDKSSIPGLGRPLEKGMETHTSILSWRFPWTEEPGGSVYGFAENQTLLMRFSKQAM